MRSGAAGRVDGGRSARRSGRRWSGDRGGFRSETWNRTSTTTSTDGDVDQDVEHRVGLIAAVAGLGLGVVAFAAALRRFGVGIEGSMLPWRWDTYPTVVPPTISLTLAVVASVGLGRAVIGAAQPSVGSAWQLRWIAADRTRSPVDD